MEDDAYLHMWRFWRDKFGPVEALRRYYPVRLAQYEQLRLAVYQIEAAEALINQVMTGETPV